MSTNDAHLDASAFAQLAALPDKATTQAPDQPYGGGHRIGRRGVLLGTSGSALVAVAASAVPAPAGVPLLPQPGDAELIARCREFDWLERGKADLYRDGATPIIDDDKREEAAQPLHDRQAVLLDRMFALRATSLAGIAARARTIHRYLPDLLSPACLDGWDNRMTAALVRDLVLMPDATFATDAATTLPMDPGPS